MKEPLNSDEIEMIIAALNNMLEDYRAALQDSRFASKRSLIEKNIKHSESAINTLTRRDLQILRNDVSQIHHVLSVLKENSEAYLDNAQGEDRSETLDNLKIINSALRKLRDIAADSPQPL